MAALYNLDSVYHTSFYQFYSKISKLNPQKNHKSKSFLQFESTISLNLLELKFRFAPINS